RAFFQARDVDRREADAAGRGVQQNGGAFAEVSAEEHHVVRRAVDDGEPGALFEGHLRGELEDLIGGDAERVGVAAEVGDAHHAIAFRERGDAFYDAIDFAR